MKLQRKARQALGGQLGESNQCHQAQQYISISDQRSMILNWFFYVNSRLSDAKLGIMSPASRILELRRMGHKIEMIRERQEDVSHTFHPTGVYICQEKREVII